MTQGRDERERRSSEKWQNNTKQNVDADLQNRSHGILAGLDLVRECHKWPDDPGGTSENDQRNLERNTRRYRTFSMRKLQ